MNDLDNYSCGCCGKVANYHHFANGAGWICKRCGTSNRFADLSAVKVIGSHCTECGWFGSVDDQKFVDGWHVCPSCHQAEFLVSGDELDEMNELEGATF